MSNPSSNLVRAGHPTPACALFLAALLLVTPSPARGAAARTPSVVPPKSVTGTGLNFTVVSAPAPLIQCLIGASIPTRNATLVAPDSAAATFTGGTGILGFESGLALSSGRAPDARGPNEGTSVGTARFAPGDSDLDALVDPEQTFDAAVLEFEFFTDQPRVFTFQYVFSSDEYSEFVGLGFDDVFAFFLNGNTPANNIARVPAGCGTIADVPVSVDNVNCGNWVDPKVPSTNCGCYVTNEMKPAPDPTPLDTEMDGLTVVFTATATSIAGWNHLKLAIADSGDEILDSNVFLVCQSFIVPAREATWGQVKARYH
jgi:hypothetical protein